MDNSCSYQRYHRSRRGRFGVGYRIWYIFRSLAAACQENAWHAALDGAHLGVFLLEVTALSEIQVKELGNHIGVPAR